MVYKRKPKRRIAVIDFETDPFLHGRLPRPFSWGFYDGVRYVEHWQTRAWESNECVEVLVNFLLDQDEDLVVYAHNGGKFDFLFFIEKLTGGVRIVNGRVLEARLGNHILRDSYGILPIPLAKLGGKLSIDYKLMERHCREDHKEEILHYQKIDCIELHKAVTLFTEEFGEQLTIGGTAMKQLKKFHAFDSGNERFDAEFRKYYYGGRCQCFETGIIETDVKGYDVNSSYPFTMKTMRHPIVTDYSTGFRITKATAFVEWEGKNFNAVPVRTKSGLDFTVPHGKFFTTIHEFEAALDTGTIKPERILQTVDFRLLKTFENFIDWFYDKRLKAGAAGDVFHKEFYKLILNSAYGKFAQNPENYEDSIILPWDESPNDGIDDPELEYTMKMSGLKYRIWTRPTSRKNYLNVATAASITGGSRATLLRGLANSTRPLYCDTDSIYCEGMRGIADATKLGAWKLEFEGKAIAIAGKKLYAVVDEKGDCIKKASKGATLSHMAIAMIARGDKCETRNDAPSFKLDGKHEFIKRLIGPTVLVDHSDVESQDDIMIDA